MRWRAASTIARPTCCKTTGDARRRCAATARRTCARSSAAATSSTTRRDMLAKDADRERWNATRFMRGNHSSCDHCHQGVGDKQDAAGNRLEGSQQPGRLLGDGGHVRPLHRPAAALRAAPDAVLHQFVERLQAECRRRRHPRRHRVQPLPLRRARSEDRQSLPGAGHGRDPRIGDAADRATTTCGARTLYRQKCARCHGPQALGTVAHGRVLYPALAGPESFNLRLAHDISRRVNRSCRASSAATCRWGRKAARQPAMPGHRVLHQHPAAARGRQARSAGRRWQQRDDDASCRR